MTGNGKMNQLVSGLKAAAEPTRLSIISLCAGNDLSVSDLVRILGQSQPRISKHLRILVDAGILTRSREGNHIFHRASREPPGGPLVNHVLSLLSESGIDVTPYFDTLSDIKAERAHRAALFFDEIAEDWDRLRRLHVAEETIEKALIEAMPAEPVDRLIDIGTGTGRILECVAPYCRQGIGVDKSHKMLSLARSRLDSANLTHCSLRHGDMYALEFRDGLFDIAISHMVLHFAEEPQSALAEAARILKPKGQLLLVDFVAHDQEELRTNGGHFWLGFDEARLNELMADAGLTLDRLQILPGAPISVFLCAARKTDDQPQPAKQD